MKPSKLATRNGLLTLLLLAALGVALMPLEAWAQAQDKGIGFVIARTGAVTIVSESAVARPISLRQAVFYGDTLVTGPKSTTKVLFDDNTILSVSENTELQITDYIYDRRKAKRTTVFTMALGRVKALVADFYAATDSRFEIHTPSAVAAARGTGMVVWIIRPGAAQRFGAAQTKARIIRVQENGVATGIASIDGTVQVTNPLGQSVTLFTGTFTIVQPALPPSPPAPIATSPAAQQNVNESDVTTDPTVESEVIAQTAKQEQEAEQDIAAAEKAPAEEEVAAAEEAEEEAAPAEEAPPAEEVAEAEEAPPAEEAAPGPVDVVLAPALVEAPQVDTITTIDVITAGIPCTVISPSGNFPIGCVVP